MPSLNPDGVSVKGCPIIYPPGKPANMPRWRPTPIAAAVTTAPTAPLPANVCQRGRSRGGTIKDGIAQRSKCGFRECVCRLVNIPVQHSDGSLYNVLWSELPPPTNYILVGLATNENISFICDLLCDLSEQLSSACGHFLHRSLRLEEGI